MRAHCLFEQSGTFKNEFKKLGIEAYDYDILNNFGETDYVVDLFQEIENGYERKPSIFDNIRKDDITMAFFPCTRFEDQIQMGFRGTMHQLKNWSSVKKIEYSMKLHEELHRLYMLIGKLFIIFLRGGKPLIVENPYSATHYLVKYFPIKATIIDKDRTEDGDYFKKPTQYWFVNCKPQSNLVWEPLLDTPSMRLKYDAQCISDIVIDGVSREEKRSLIHPQYARRFILRYIGHSVLPLESNADKEQI